MKNTQSLNRVLEGSIPAIRKSKTVISSLVLISILGINANAMPAFLEEIWEALSAPFASLTSPAVEESEALAPAAGVIYINGMGEAYGQNFDTLVSSNTSDIMPDGWYFIETGSGSNLTYQAGDGNGAAGDTFSFGANGAADRALGSLYTNQVKPVFGASFINNTGGTITSLDIAFAVEQWRLGSAGRADRTDFQISTDATSLTAGTWTDTNALDLVTPSTASPIGARDGNAVGNKAQVSASVTGLNIPNGSGFWIRWVDADSGGQNDGLAIDDVSITPQGIAPPNTTITSAPSALSNSASASIGFTSNDSGATFECSFDGSAYAACTSPFTVSGLSQGAHSFLVRAKNITGTDSTPASVSWSVDSMEPDTAISSTPAQFTNSQSASLAFEATDASGITGYECSLDGGAYSACVSPFAASALTEGPHSLSVRAIDGAGNVEATPATVSWTVDLTPPVVADFTPLPDAPPSHVNTLTVDVTDDKSLAVVEIHYIIGNQSNSAPCTLVSGATYSCSIPGQSNNTTVVYHVSATDAAGNAMENPTAGVPSAYTVGAGSVPPGQYKHFNPAAGATLAGDVTVTGSVTLDGTLNTGNGKLTLGCNTTINGADSTKFVKGRIDKTVCGAGTFIFPVGTQKTSPVAESFGGTTASAVVIDEYTPLAIEITSGVFPAVLSVSVTDSSIVGGAVTQSLKRTWNITESGDITANLTFNYLEGDVVGTEGLFTVLKREDPTTSVVTEGIVDASANTFSVAGVSSFSDWSAGMLAETNEPESTISSATVGGVTNSTSNSLTFGATDDSGVDRLECSFDGAAFSTCVSPLALSSLGDGAHTLLVRAVDVQGNVESTPASFSWTVDTVEPESALTSAPVSVSKDKDAVFTFSANDVSNVSVFECSVDGGAFGPCTSPFTVTSLGDGVHTFAVRATDDAGNVEATPVVHTWTVDTTEPGTTMNSAQSTLTNNTSSSFTFSGTDLNGVASYVCSLDGGAFAPCASPTSFTGLSDGDHTFTVKAVDAAGNVDSVGASVSWTVDTAEPESSLLTTPDSVTNDTSASFTFSATDSSAIAGFECSVDGGAYAPCSSPITLPPTGEGAHTFAVRAIDAAGNSESTPSSFSWTVDTTEPESSLTTNPDALTNGTSASFGFNASDASGVTGYLCSLDGGAFAPCTSPVSFTGIGEGAHSFEVKAIDAAGNTETAGASYSWTVDLTAPETTIDSSIEAVNNRASVEIAFSGTDANGVASFACSTDGGSYFACTSPFTWSPLGEGSHTFRVKSTDAAGNTDVTAAELSWGTDTTPPETSLTAKPESLVNTGTASFEFSATDTSAIGGFVCSVDGGAYVPCTSPFEVAGLGDGDHTFSVKATDAAGNLEATPESWSWTVDTTAPTSSFGVTPDAVTRDTSATFTFSATDASSIDGFVCSTDGGSFAPCTSPMDLSGLGEGAHSLRVKATDVAGNTETSAVEFTWTVDLTGPQIADFAPAAAAQTGETRTVSVDVTDNVAVGSVKLIYNAGGGDQTVDCYLAGSAYDCTIPAQIGGTVVTYYVSGFDVAGNDAVAPSASVRNLYTVGAASIPSGTYSSVNPASGSVLSGDVTVQHSLNLDGIIGAGSNSLVISCEATVTGASATSFVTGIVKKEFCASGSFSYPVGTVTTGAQASEDYSPVVVTATAGTYPSSLSVEASKTPIAGSSPLHRLGREWHIQESGDLTVDMTFKYLDGDVTGNEAVFGVIKRSGASTSMISGGTVDGAANTFSVSGVDSFSSWSAGILAPLAAGVEISGRIMTPDRRGIGNVAVYLSGGDLAEPLMVKTNQFGRYTFTDLEIGQGYVIQVVSKKFVFSNPQRFVQLFENLAEEDFVAERNQ